MTHWHAIRCKTGYEFDVAQAILDMGLDVQCPVQVRVIQARRKNQRHRLVRARYGPRRRAAGGALAGLPAGAAGPAD